MKMIVKANIHFHKLMGPSFSQFYFIFQYDKRLKVVDRRRAWQMSLPKVCGTPIKEGHGTNILLTYWPKVRIHYNVIMPTCLLIRKFYSSLKRMFQQSQSKRKSYGK